MIKGALFDIDDTLYSHTLNRVPGATLKALDKLKEKGIKIGICTSRVNAEMGSFPEELWNRIDCKVLGTGAITMIEDRYYKAYTIDRELVKKYTDYFNERHINYDYTDINGDLYYWGNPDYVNKGRYLKMAGGKVMFKEYEDEDITNLFFFEATDEEYEHIQTIDPDIQISRWGNSGNICAKLVDKSFGLLKFCQMYSLTTDEVVAAGDGGNDDVMLEMAGIGIATDDAKDNTKKAADYICDKSIEDGGLYDALVDLKIIDEDRYEPKMFVFDYDSTLYDHKEGKIQENTLKALKELKENGKILCLNTSRSLAECINIPEEIKQMMNTIILSNGAMIITGNESKTTYINDEEVKKIIDYCDRNKLTYRYVLGNGTGYLNKHDEDKENLFYRLYRMIPDIKKYEGEKIIHLLIYADFDGQHEISEIIQESEICYLGLACEVSPKGYTKGSATLMVMEGYGLKREETCAFGDGGNDIEMIKAAGLGVAMGNGRQELKNEADYIAHDISDDGLYRTMKHFGFVKG